MCKGLRNLSRSYFLYKLIVGIIILGQLFNAQIKHIIIMLFNYICFFMYYLIILVVYMLFNCIKNGIHVVWLRQLFKINYFIIVYILLFFIYYIFILYMYRIIFILNTYMHGMVVVARELNENNS